MLSQLFRLATLAKGAVALSLVTGAYGAATTSLADQRPIVASAHMEFTNQVTPTPHPIARRETREGTTQTEVTNPSVEALVRECATKYARVASFKDAPSAEREEAGRLVKEVCERATKASGLEADAFWAKYRSLFGQSAKNGEETKRPETSTKGEPDASFEGLLRECTTSYARLVSSKEMPAAEREDAGRPVREVCERAVKASGLEAGAFWAKYRSQFGTARNEETKRPDADQGVADASFEGLLKECATKYLRLVSSKEMPAAEREEAGRLVRAICERAIKASGLDADAFWAKYRSLIAHSTTKSEETKQPERTKAEPDRSFEALFKECVTKYARASSLREATTVEREEAGRLAKDACERAIKASGLETGAFWAKYGRYMTPTTKLEHTTSPKPSASPKPVVTDPLVRECYAKYQELATLRNGTVETYEAAVRTFSENCRRVLEANHN